MMTLLSVPGNDDIGINTVDVIEYVQHLKNYINVYVLCVSPSLTGRHEATISLGSQNHQELMTFLESDQDPTKPPHLSGSIK